MTKPSLARELGFVSLLIYGIGDILGAGIYALVGKVVGAAGSGAWVSFLIAGALAAVTGLTYAEFSSRIPRSAGAAAFCAAAFQNAFMPFLVGLLVLASGVTSAATVSGAMVGYLHVILPGVPPQAAVILFLCLVAGLAFWGIRESVGANNVFTFIEAAGLLTVIIGGIVFAVGGNVSDPWSVLSPGTDWEPWLAGATLSFFAFVGFEDLANLAEEAKDPQRDLPRAILGAVAVCGVIYLLVVVAVLICVPAEQAARSATPLLDVLSASGMRVPGWLFSAVALFAVANTGLANFVMASRLLYGMADQRLLPTFLAQVHPKRRTPAKAVVAAAVICGTLALSGGTAVLAKSTSLMLITVFFCLHVGLILVRRRERNEKLLEGIFRAPGWTPYVGAIICVILALKTGVEAHARLAVVLGVITFLYIVGPARTARSSAKIAG